MNKIYEESSGMGIERLVLRGSDRVGRVGQGKKRAVVSKASVMVVVVLS